MPISCEELNLRCQDTLMDHLGIEFTEIGDQHLTARMPVDRRTCQPMDIVHGGATAALAETVASAAANYCVEKSKLCLGLDLNINHIRTVSKGFVTAVAKPLHLGKSTQVWEIHIRNEEGQLVSAARLTIAVIAKDPNSTNPGKSYRS